jgi:hypothetical protein
MRGIILAILIILIVTVLLCPGKASVRECNCPKCNQQRFVGELASMRMPLTQESMQRGLNDVEQSTISRGVVPYQNQPDHVANLWKCDYSHPRTLEGAGCLDTIFASDYPTPLRGAMVNQNVGDVSNMHLVSRFAGVRS